MSARRTLDLRRGRSNPLGQRFRIRSRKGRIAAALCLGAIIVPTYYSLAFGRLVINGSDSLEANAFVMVTWPKPLIPGAIVALKMPDVLQAGLDLEDGQAVLVKRVVANAGTPIRRDGQALCVSDRCLGPFERSDGKALAMWDGETVPRGTVFVAGDSPHSLDSRYAAIGPRPIGDVLAVGISVPLPDWRSLRALLRGGG